MTLVMADQTQQVLFDLWGGQGEVSTHPDALAAALEITDTVIEDVDAACSTFREDSDISLVNARAGQWVPVGEVFLDVLTQTLHLSSATSGRLDPTVGHRLLDSGIHVHGADYRQVEIEGDLVRIPAHMRLDLNATAKAWCADTAAAAAAQHTGHGVLVGLCGDIATSGPAPTSGWSIVCGDDHRAPGDGPWNSLLLADGGLATSSTTVRRTAAGSHILDPATLRPVTGPWRTVSVVAATCAQANAAATAALVMGPEAFGWLTSLKLPARLVRVNGAVEITEGWPR